MANLFLHYAFDRWMAREFPAVRFERYAMTWWFTAQRGPGPARCSDAIAERLAQVGLELHPDKTRIVYCKDANRRGSHEHERFDFLGYTFRPRLGRERTRQVLRQLLSGGQRRRRQGDAPRDPMLAAAPAQ